MQHDELGIQGNVAAAVVEASVPRHLGAAFGAEGDEIGDDSRARDRGARRDARDGGRRGALSVPRL